ncbi:hypothetical protein ACJMK2_005733 [Sinanodonta woodiana]|uniref:Uncharacterized protein n=1 Tax=Sinanodonta woodiana TaxID=1069815 RepID=A0ABD3VR04_SINWO
MSELDEASCSDEHESLSLTKSGEDSAEDNDLQENEDNDSQEEEKRLNAISIYRLIFDKVGKLKEHLNTSSFKQIDLNWNQETSGFNVELFAKSTESKCNLFLVMKNFMKDKNEREKSYTRETYILIAVNCDDRLNGAFAICTGAGHFTVKPFVDTTYAYSVSKKILDPTTVGQLKCRYLNGQIISIDKLFHKDRRGSYLPTVSNDSFFITEEFQAQIKVLNDSSLKFLSTLRSSVYVTRFRLKIMKCMYMGDMLCLMKELLYVHQSNDYKDDVNFGFLNYVKLVTFPELREKLDGQLETYLLEESNVNMNEFFMCHKNYEQWVKCEEVKLMVGKVPKSTWGSRPDISDIFVALGKERIELSSLEIKYKSGRTWRSDKLLNYIHGHIFLDTKYYFHIGKDWYEVDVEYIRKMEHTFFDVVKEKLLIEEDEGYLPLPWCSEKSPKKQINADHCIAFCKDVLRKELSEEEKTQMKKIDMTELLKSLTLQDDQREEASPSAGNDSANSGEGNNHPLSDSHVPVKDDNDVKSLQEKKKQSGSRKTKKIKYDVSKVKSTLSKIIGENESKLYLNCLTYGDEEKYNEMYYILLNKFLKENRHSSYSSLNDNCDPTAKFPTYLLGDKILVEGVELFDILKITKDKLYLYHVKEGFGQKTRDATSQIRISANLLSKARETNTIYNVFGKYYDQITNYKGDDETRIQLMNDLKGQKKEFLKLFVTKKIVKPFKELISDEQPIIQKDDIYTKMAAKSEEMKAEINLLCESLTSNSILVQKDNGFIVEKEFLHLLENNFLQICKRELTDSHAKTLFQILQKHRIPTVSVKSHIAKFELIRLAHDFTSFYPDFELSICQIRKP